MSAPCRRSVPAAGRTSPDATLNSVVLPAPFGPISPVIRPTGAARLTSLSATWPPYLTVIWASSRPSGAARAGTAGAAWAGPGTAGAGVPPLAAALAAGPREETAAGTGGGAVTRRRATRLRNRCSRSLRGVKPSATSTADTPNRTFSQSVTVAPVEIQDGRTTSEKPPAKAYQGSRPGMMTSSASRVRELNAVKSELVTVCTTPPNRAPETAARKAETQKTSTRVTITLVPCVARATGESAMPRSSRPSLLRTSHMTIRLTSTAKANTR